MGMLLSRHYADNKTEGVAKKVAPSPSVKEAEVKNEATEELGFTAEDINKMAGPKLRKLAKQYDVENPEDLTANELKAILCDKIVK